MACSAGSISLPARGHLARAANAEGALRAGESLAFELLDIDFDGHEEIWVHSANPLGDHQPPARRAIEELTRFSDGVNFADALTRRRESYHVLAAREAAKTSGTTGKRARGRRPLLDSAPSIHDIEHGNRLDVLPPVDRVDRAILQECIVAGDVRMESWSSAVAPLIRSWATESMAHRATAADGAVEVVLAAADGSLEKRLTFFPDGRVRASFRWEPSTVPGALFCTELSLEGSPSWWPPRRPNGGRFRSRPSPSRSGDSTGRCRGRR